MLNEREKTMIQELKEKTEAKEVKWHLPSKEDRRTRVTVVFEDDSRCTGTGESILIACVNAERAAEVHKASR